MIPVTGGAGFIGSNFVLDWIATQGTAVVNLKSVMLTPQTLASYDLVLLATNHDAFDYKMIKQHAKMIVDTRGVYLEPADNIVKA